MKLSDRELELQAMRIRNIQERNRVPQPVPEPAKPVVKKVAPKKVARGRKGGARK